MISVADALDDEAFLGPFFRGESWDAWRAILLAAQGQAEQMTPSQRAIFAEVAQREPPSEAVRELFVVGGRRGGKDSAASAIIAVASMSDYTQFIRPGETPTILCLAVDREQAGIIMAYVKGIFGTVPMLKSLVTSETKDGLKLANGNRIVVATNDYRSLRGRTVVVAVFDELAFWKDDNSVAPCLETYRAVRPGMLTIPDSLLVGITTPWRRQGLAYDKWVKSFGKNDPKVLVVQATTQQLNPTIDLALIEEEMERDAAAARAEYFAEWRDDLSDFVDRLAVERCVDKEHTELAPAGHGRVGFLDVAGGSGKDAMALAIAHKEEKTVVLDVLRWRDPPFSPREVTADFSAVCLQYDVRKLVCDKWGSDWVIESFREAHIDVSQTAEPKSEIYLNALPLINSGTCRLLNIPKLINQICSLERRAARSGRDTVDCFRRDGHEDLANAALGSLVLAANTQPAFVLPPGLLDKIRASGLRSRTERSQTGELHVLEPRRRVY
ncbi:MAG: terminase large subunit [Methylovirgula sp.]